MLEILTEAMMVVDAWTVRMMDPVLGGLLHLHRDVALFLVAAGTVLLMVVVRKKVTDQTWLEQAHGDQARLDELIKGAKKTKNKEAIARYKQTKNKIQMRATKFELKPFLIVIVPVLLLVTWCFSRLGFEPPREGEPVRVKLHAAKSTIGNLVHLAPVDGLTVRDGWVRRVERESLPRSEHPWDQGNAWMVDKFGRLMAWVTRIPQVDPETLLEGAVFWEVSALARVEPYPLRIVLDGKPYETELLVGQKRYAPGIKLINDGKVISLNLLMRPRRLFGFVGALDWLFCPPWLVAYMFIAIPFYFLFKKVLNVY